MLYCWIWLLPLVVSCNLCLGCSMEEMRIFPLFFCFKIIGDQLFFFFFFSKFLLKIYLELILSWNHVFLILTFVLYFLLLAFVNSFIDLVFIILYPYIFLIPNKVLKFFPCNLCARYCARKRCRKFNYLLCLFYETEMRKIFNKLSYLVYFPNLLLGSWEFCLDMFASCPLS